MIVNIKEKLVMLHETDFTQPLFEGEIPLDKGMSYNSYLFLDEKTCLLDTSAKETKDTFYKELLKALNGRELDYVVIHHLEPDHTACIREIVKKFPKIQIFISMMGSVFFKNFFPDLADLKLNIIKEGDTLPLGSHTLKFIAAPMVHWPEVMMSYEENNQILFSADAFGSFVTAHDPYEKNFVDKEVLLNESRRYFTNVISKYTTAVLALIQKIKDLPLKMILSLHGLIHEDNIPTLFKWYQNWCTHSPEEEEGVLILYASVYGNTQEAALYLEKGLKARGVKTTIHSLNLTDVSYALSDTFIYSKVILLATTFNVGLYPKMEFYLRTIIEHGIQNKHFYLIENGSWAPQARDLMSKYIGELTNCTIDPLTLTIKSALKDSDYPFLDQIVKSV